MHYLTLPWNDINNIRDYILNELSKDEKNYLFCQCSTARSQQLHK